MKELAIITCADSAYESLIPLFVLSATTAYPSYTVYVLGSHGVGKDTLEVLKEVGGNCVVIQNCFPYPKDCVSPVLAAKSVRWLAFQPDFLDYKYVIFVDLDMLLCNEPEGIVGPHTSHSFRLHLPYSAKMRAEGNRVSSRILAESGPWFDRIVPKMAKYKQRILSGYYGGRTSDEKMLYEILCDSGLGLPPTVQQKDDPLTRWNPHHGIHLSIAKDTERFATRLENPQYEFLYEDYPLYIESFRQRTMCHPWYEYCIEMANQKDALDRLLKLG